MKTTRKSQSTTPRGKPPARQTPPAAKSPPALAATAIPVTELAVAAVTALIKEAAERHASDIHLDPTDDGRGDARVRVDGVLHGAQPLPARAYGDVIDRIKLMAGMDPAEKRMPQDGRIRLRMNDREIDLRVCVAPVVGGEHITMRLLDRQIATIDLDRVVRSPADREIIRGLTRLPNGIVVCTGPTGSGKTTLLYSMLGAIDSHRHSIVSIEDPVEYRLKGVAQMQVSPSAGLTFIRAMRTALRLDPDVILVGEIRDLETLQAVSQCALTGHLVLTTLHTNTAAGALRRMVDVGLEPYLVNSTVQAIVAQRLVRVLCPACRRTRTLPRNQVPPAALAWLDSQKRPAQFGQAVGCEACRNTGYRGRAALHEILIVNEAVRAEVSQGADPDRLHAAAVAAGMRPLLQCGIALAADGETTLEEVLRVVPLTIGA